MRDHLRSKLFEKAKNHHTGQRKTFCGNTGAVVDCGPRECHYLEGLCRQKLGEVVEKHRPILQVLRNNIQKKSDRTGASPRDLAMQDYGDLIGLLVGLIDNGKDGNHA